MSRVFQKHSYCYDKREKIRKSKLGKFIFAAKPSLSKRWGEVVANHSPIPQLFSRANFLISFYIDTWVFGQRLGKLTEWQS